jgi:hypothetical protein
VSSLEDTAWPITSSIAGSKTWQDYWILRPSAAAANKVRLVATYTPSATAGTLQPDKVWSVAPTNGEAYELHGFFEPGTEFPTLINDGLKLCMIPVEFSFSPSSATNTRHSLATAASWLTDPVWVRSVGVLGSGQVRDSNNPYIGIRGEAYLDATANAVYLNIGAFNTTDTIYVTALKPAYYHCAAAATPTTFTQSGLSAEGDVVPIDLEWAGYAALAEGWRRKSEILVAEANPRLVQSLAQAAALFSRWDPGWKDRLPQTLIPMRRWGPGR